MWSGLLSRVVVTIVALPGVIALVYLGGWWIATLAVGVAFLALHEYAEVIRPLRPLVLACYVGALAVVLGAQLGGLEWMVAGFLSTLPASCSSSRGSREPGRQPPPSPRRSWAQPGSRSASGTSF